MFPGVRLLLAVCLGTLLLALTTLGAATAAAYHGGTVAVEVRELDDNQISLKLPAGVVDLGVAFVPSCFFRDVAEEVKPFWPAVQAASAELSRYPDAVFVEVRSRDGNVTIQKSGNRLLVRVDSHHEKVRVAVPLSTLSRVLDRLEDVM